MRRLGARTRFGTAARRAAAAVLVATAMLTGTGGFAAADEPAATTVFMLTTMPNGWQSRLDLRPVLEIRSDGTAVRRPDGGPRELQGKVPTEVTTAAATEIRALAQVDLGTPTVTDQGNMILDFMPAQPDPDVHLIVYAPESTEGLTDEQVAARARFATLYDKLLDAFSAS
ncbi:hypothetical protein [Nocardia sp. IFM 10818]